MIYDDIDISAVVWEQKCRFFRIKEYSSRICPISCQIS